MSPHSTRSLRIAGLAMLLAALPTLCAQTTGAKTSPLVQTELAAKDDTLMLAEQLGTITEDDSAAPGIVPQVKGFNAALVTTSQHDSNVGWSSALLPSLSYRFNKHFSIELQTPVYAYINAEKTIDVKNSRGVVTGTTLALEPQHFLLGDTLLNGGFDAHAKWLDYNLAATLGLPTGDDADGLGAGKPTYAFTNHFEHQIKDTFVPNLELGIDNSPNLLSNIHKTYTDVGTNAHFQTGLGISLPWDFYFESNAYEELPLATQTVTSTTTKGKKGKQITTYSQKSIGEDNGFQSTLEIPLTRHIVLNGFYNRSLRNKIDTAGFSFTFLLRSPLLSKQTAIH